MSDLNLFTKAAEGAREIRDGGETPISPDLKLRKMSGGLGQIHPEQPWGACPPRGHDPQQLGSSQSRCRATCYRLLASTTGDTTSPFAVETELCRRRHCQHRCQW